MIGGVAVPTSLPPTVLPKEYDPVAAAGKADPWKALLSFGLNMMASGSKPGATLLGAAGEGGQAAMKQAEADATKKQATAWQKYQADMSHAQTQSQMDAAQRQYTLSVGNAASTAAHQTKMEGLAESKDSREAAKSAIELQYLPEKERAEIAAKQGLTQYYQNYSGSSAVDPVTGAITPLAQAKLDAQENRTDVVEIGKLRGLVAGTFDPKVKAAYQQQIDALTAGIAARRSRAPALAGVSPQAAAAPAPSAPPIIARNPQTGQSVQLVNGQWVPYNGK